MVCWGDMQRDLAEGGDAVREAAADVARLEELHQQRLESVDDLSAHNRTLAAQMVLPHPLSQFWGGCIACTAHAFLAVSWHQHGALGASQDKHLISHSLGRPAKPFQGAPAMTSLRHHLPLQLQAARQGRLPCLHSNAFRSPWSRLSRAIPSAKQCGMGA